MYQKCMAGFLAAVMVCLCVLGAFSPKAAAGETYITDTDLADNATAAPGKDTVVPDANQYRYQKEELAAFCHFGPNTFTGVEWGDSYGDTPAAELFTLTQDFDAETLVSTLKEAGFQKLIVTAKHHDGFCIWDSAYTEYDVAATAYRDADGNRDILAEISAACTEYDMDMGLYLSPWDMNAESYGYYDENGNPVSSPADDHLDYNDYYNNQLTEILSSDKYGNAGHFTEVWMDGAKGSGQDAQEYDFQRWFATIQKYEGTNGGTSTEFDADCMLFGAEAYTTVRWIGNESGYAAEETWAKSIVDYDANTIDSNTVGSYTQGFENGNKWTVPEADARITSGWFWSASKSTPKSIEDLATMYFNSVGHNSVLLLNVPPNDQGTVDDAILSRVREFGSEIEQTFQTNLAASASVSATQVRGGDTAYKPSNVLDGNDDTYWTVDDGTTTASMLIDLGAVQSFDVVSIEEAIQFGQRIKSFTVEYRDAQGQWQTFDEGTTIGSKRLCRKTPVRADQVRITVTTSEAVPMITEVGVYKASAGFELASAVPQGMEVIDITDSAFTLAGGWTSETGSQFVNGTNAWANGNTSGSVYAQLSFTGSKVYLIGTVDPNHGEASVYIDDALVATVDTNATARSLGQTIFESETLTAGEHTLKLVCTESGKAIGLEAAYVINNGGLGMIGLEQAEYTMDEASETEIKLVRVGGSTGEVTVTLTPNPGSAVQGDFDADLVQVITFADGETEKTATVRTKRNTNKTGPQYFTAELSCDNTSLILGFVSKAKIWINDLEETDRYTGVNPFVFPSELNSSAVLEAEYATLTNSGENETWPLTVTESSWASNGKFVNSLNRGDRIDIPYVAEKAGVYTVTATYRSGAETNYLAWYEADGNITAGTASAGNADASVTKTAEFELVVETAGAGTLTFAPTAADSPQLDKFDIVLKEIFQPATWTVTLNYNDGATENEVRTIENGQSIGTLPTPSRDGYTFGGWFSGETAVTSDTVVEEDMTLTAKWTEVPDPTEPSVEPTDPSEEPIEPTEESTQPTQEPTQPTEDPTEEPTAPTQEPTEPQSPAYDECQKDETCPIAKYTDCELAAWYHDGVHYCIDDGLMNGTGDATFEPDAPTSRAMLVTILYRMEGSPDISGLAEPFDDVTEDHWFYEEVVWAYNEGVVNGTSATTFEPDTSITREQLATIVYRYAGSPKTEGDLTAYADAARVNDYAVDALVWATQTGIINGIQHGSATNLAPRPVNENDKTNTEGLASRAQVAVILFRYLEK